MQAEPVSPFPSFADSGMFGPVDYDMLDESAEVDHDDMVMEEEEVIMEEQMMDEVEDFPGEVNMDVVDDQDGTMGDASAPEDGEQGGEHDEPMGDETVEDNRSENYEIIEVQLTDQIPSSDNVEVPSQITDSEVFTSHQVETFEFTSTYDNHAFPSAQAEEIATPQQESPVYEVSSLQETAQYSEEPSKDHHEFTHHSEEPLNELEEPANHVAKPDILEEHAHQDDIVENEDAASTHSSTTLRNDSSLIEGSAIQENATHESEGQPTEEVPVTSTLTGSGEYPYPIIVSYDSSRVLLFPPQDSWYEEGAFNNQYTKLPREFFVQDFNACDETFSELFLRFREVLGDNVGDDEELHIDMEVLGLRFGEDNLGCKNWSLRRVLQAYLSLHRNDGHNFPTPLEMTLYTSPRFTSRLEYMLELVDDGKGVAEYTSRLKLQDEATFHGAQDDYHSPSYEHENHESFHVREEQEPQADQHGSEDAEDDHPTEKEHDSRSTGDVQADQNPDHDGETVDDAGKAAPINDSPLERIDQPEDIVHVEEDHTQDISTHDQNSVQQGEPVSASALSSELTKEVTVEVTTVTTNTPQKTTDLSPTEPIDPFDDDLLESDDEDGAPDSHSPSVQHTSNTAHTDSAPRNNDTEQASPTVETQELSRNLPEPVENNVSSEHTSAIPVYSPEDEDEHDDEGHGGQYTEFGGAEYEEQQYSHEGDYQEETTENYPDSYEEGHGFYDDAEENENFEENDEGEIEKAGYEMEERSAQVQVLDSTETQSLDVIDEHIGAENGGEQEAVEGVDVRHIDQESEEIPSHDHHELDDSFDDDDLVPYEEEEDERNVEDHVSLDHHSGTHTPQKRGREDEEDEAEGFQDEDDLQATKRARAD